MGLTVEEARDRLFAALAAVDNGPWLVSTAPYEPYRPLLRPAAKPVQKVRSPKPPRADKGLEPWLRDACRDLKCETCQGKVSHRPQGADWRCRKCGTVRTPPPTPGAIRYEKVRMRLDLPEMTLAAPVIEMEADTTRRGAVMVEDVERRGAVMVSWYPHMRATRGRSRRYEGFR
jgi:hypothetical protein